MALTADEKQALTSEWHSLVLTTDAKVELGRAIFRQLFEEHPDYIQLFKQFRSMKNLDEIVESPQLRSHALRFMNAFTGIMETLDDAVCLVDMLHNVGETHKNRNVTLTHFQGTIPVVKAIIGPRMKTDLGRHALEKILDAAGPHIAEKL